MSTASKTRSLRSYLGSNTVIAVLAVLTFLTQISNFYGEDIVNARANFLHGSRTDFWGGISSFVYGNIPNIWPRWQIWLALFQILATWVALKKLYPVKIENRLYAILQATISYLTLMFAAQMTRDGLMFALLLLGVAIFRERFNQQPSIKTLAAATLLISFGLSFRPWMAISIIPILLILSQREKLTASRIVTTLIVITVIITPIALEVGAAKLLKLVRSYPEQQVMLMDTAASFCYTNNLETGEKAKKLFKHFTSDADYPQYACQLFRTDTWLSLTNGGNASSKDLKPKFWLIKEGDVNNYNNVRDSWIKLILSDPVTYIQNKLLFAQRLMIASDSRSFELFSANSKVQKFSSIYKFPYEIVISAHLLSIFGCLLILIAFPIVRMFKSGNSFISINSFTLGIMASLLLWTACSVVAFIGSNGRYTYTITLLAFSLCLAQWSWRSETSATH